MGQAAGNSQQAPQETHPVYIVFWRRKQKAATDRCMAKNTKIEGGEILTTNKKVKVNTLKLMFVPLEDLKANGGGQFTLDGVCCLAQAQVASPPEGSLVRLVSYSDV